MSEILLLLVSVGADSLHFQLRHDHTIVCSGRFMRIGRQNAFFEIHDGTGEPYSESVGDIDHRVALRSLIDRFHRNSRISRISDIDAIVYRISHGGGVFTGTTLMNREQLHRLHSITHLTEDLSATVMTIGAGLSQVPHALHIGVFETGLTSTLPMEARSYAIDRHVAQSLHMQRFGFFGISHQGAILAAQELVRRTPRPRSVISVCIEDRTSVVATVDGIAVESSTGVTSAEGLPGLHGIGSVDPRLPLYVAAVVGASPQQADVVLSRRSGIGAMAGRASWKEIEQGVKDGDRACIEALMLLSYRISQSIAASIVATGSIDMIVFSGEGASWMVMQEVCRRLSPLGVRAVADIRKHPSAIVSHPRSKAIVVRVRMTPEEALLRAAQNVIASHERASRAPPKKVRVVKKAAKKKRTPRR